MAKHTRGKQQQTIGNDLPINMQRGRVEYNEQGRCQSKPKQCYIEFAVVSALTRKRQNEGKQIQSKWQYPQKWNDGHLLGDLIRDGQQKQTGRRAESNP